MTPWAIEGRCGAKDEVEGSRVCDGMTSGSEPNTEVGRLDPGGIEVCGNISLNVTVVDGTEPVGEVVDVAMVSKLGMGMGGKGGTPEEAVQGDVVTSVVAGRKSTVDEVGCPW